VSFDYILSNYVPVLESFQLW